MDSGSRVSFKVTLLAREQPVFMRCNHIKSAVHHIDLMAYLQMRARKSSSTSKLGWPSAAFAQRDDAVGLAALKLMRKLLKKQGITPATIVFQAEATERFNVPSPVVKLPRRPRPRKTKR